MGLRNQLRLAWDVWRAPRAGMPAVLERQQQRLAALVAGARAHSPVYADLYRDLPGEVRDLSALPPVNKRFLMDHFDDWVTDPAITQAGVSAFVADPGRIGEKYLDRFVVFSTSGATGEPAILIQDEAAMDVYNALAYGRALTSPISLGEWWRILRGGLRAASVFATGGHFVGATMMEARLRARPWRRHIQRMFSVMDPLPDLVDNLNDFEPVMLAGYASILDVLADEQEAGRLTIHPVIISQGGETLTDEMRAHLKRAFGATILDTYNASEVLLICLGCREGWQHINADWYIVEPVDADYRPAPPGEVSHTVLVTNLANHVQPIIRYDLGDRVMLREGPCPCGDPLPAMKVEGRTNDVLRLRAEDGRIVRLAPLAIGAVVEETPGVRRFQIEQVDPATLHVRLEPLAGLEPADLWPEVGNRLKAFLAKHDLANVVLRLDDAPPKRAPASGKFRQVLIAKPLSREASAAPPVVPAERR